MKPKEIREKSVEELNKTLDELHEELFRLKLRHSTGQLEQTANIGRLKRNIARVRTIIVERGREHETL